MPHYKKLPRARNGRPRAFSLVLSLTVMAMLLLLCIGAAALLTVQLRVSRATISYAKARLNAMAGARIALGELQRLVGPDQRVTATADILSNPDQTDPTQAAYYQNETQGATVVHPRWVGVWNSGRVADLTVNGADASRGEQTRLIQRTAAGYLMDSRYVNGREDWLNRRAAKTLPESSPRLAGWLVSGNEALPRTEPAALTPFSPVALVRPNDPLGRGGDVVLLGRGSLSARDMILPSPDNQPLADFLGVRVAKVNIPGANASLTGSYAYWVSDEGVKARVNLRDQFADAGRVPNAGNPGDGGFARLLIPQRYRFDISPALANPIPGAPALPSMQDGSAGVRWEKAESFDALAMTGVTNTEGLRPYYWHDITFSSAGIACDVVKGGLKKDLTAYFNASLNSGGNAVDIPDYAQVPGSGITGLNSIINEGTLEKVSPRFSLLQGWAAKAPSYSTSSSAGIPAVGPTTFQQRFVYSSAETGGSSEPAGQINPDSTSAAGGTRDDFILGIPDYSQQTQAALSPVISQFSMHFVNAIEDRGPFLNANQAVVLVCPMLTLWNPYSVPITLNDAEVDYLNDKCIAGAIYIDGNSNFWFARRPRIKFKLPARTILQPGQSKIFISDRSSLKIIYGDSIVSSIEPAAVVTTNQAQSSVLVRLIEGLPSGASYYVDYLTSWRGSAIYTMDKNPVPLSEFTFTNAISSRLGLYFSISKLQSGYDETARAEEQLVLRDGTKTLQQVNMDSLTEPDVSIWNPKYNSINSNMYLFKNNILDSRDSMPRLSQGLPSIDPNFTVGFRLKRLDRTEFVATTSSGGGGRSINFSPMVDANVRAARQSRYPFDGFDLIASPGLQYGGVWTSDPAFDFLNQPGFTPASADKHVPFYDPLSAGGKNYPGCIPYDVPYSEIGVLSLGQLRHAPLNTLPYGPSLSFGNGRIPMPAQIQASQSGLMTDRTGVDSVELSKLWQPLAQGRMYTRFNEQFRQTSRIGDNTHDIFDIAYEQNHSLWDGYRCSGIARANFGWTLSGGATLWDNQVGSADMTRTLPNSRYQVVPYSANSPYFSDPNYNLYKASFSMLEKGAFNVNSTSKVAWIALLSSFRGINVPTTEAGQSVTPTETPYLRLLKPKSGKVTGGSFEENTWSGFRTLTDQEIATLAEKIVVQVKKRGPFMSLADFVNRPLVAPVGYANWTQSELDYLGTIESAIAASNLNSRFDDSLMDRSSPDSGTRPAAVGTLRKPEFRSRHKIAGAPGYLEQSDILQQVGSALNARSDTFIVRAMGEYEGAISYVELTVQRFPEPVRTGVNNLPVNPLAVLPAASLEYAGNQFFGRHMKVLATRWLTSEEI